MLYHLLRKVSGTSIQPLAGPMALISTGLASPLSDPFVVLLRSCSPIRVNNTVAIHRCRSGRRMHGYFAASPFL